MCIYIARDIYYLNLLDVTACYTCVKSLNYHIYLLKEPIGLARDSSGATLFRLNTYLYIHSALIYRSVFIHISSFCLTGSMCKIYLLFTFK